MLTNIHENEIFVKPSIGVKLWKNRTMKRGGDRGRGDRRHHRNRDLRKEVGRYLMRKDT